MNKGGAAETGSARESTSERDKTVKMMVNSRISGRIAPFRVVRAAQTRLVGDNCNARSALYSTVAVTTGRVSTGKAHYNTTTTATLQRGMNVFLGVMGLTIHLEPRLLELRVARCSRWSLCRTCVLSYLCPVGNYQLHVFYGACRVACREDAGRVYYSA